MIVVNVLFFSGYFQDFFSLIFRNVTIMYLSVDLFGFMLVGDGSAFRIRGFMFSAKFGKFSALFLQILFQLHSLDLI